MFNTDGQTDMTKLIVAFRNFANAPNKISIVHTCLSVTTQFCEQRNPCDSKCLGSYKKVSSNFHTGLSCNVTYVIHDFPKSLTEMPRWSDDEVTTIYFETLSKSQTFNILSFEIPHTELLATKYNL